MTIVEKVLIVEPDGSVASDLRSSLKPASVSVAVVPSASSAIAWVVEHGTPDVVVIDLVLPDLDPATLVAILRRRAADEFARFFVSRDPGSDCGSPTRQF